jgi:hypothetical protein
MTPLSDASEPVDGRGGRELFDEPVHNLNLEAGQSVFVNEAKKEELEDAFPGLYHFTRIDHDPVRSPIEGDADVAYEARRAEDVEAADQAAAAEHDRDVD